MQPTPEKYRFKRILNEEDLKAWHERYIEIFPDEDDREPYSQLRGRLADPANNAFHILEDSKGMVVGVNLINFGAAAPGAEYCPYGGVVSKLRGEGMYPQMTQISDQLMRDQDALYCLSDFEDPARVPDFTDVKGESANLARMRVNFFRREMKCCVVDDSEIPYVRPGSRDDHDIQAYDLLGIRALNNQWGPVLKNLSDKVRAARPPQDRDKPVEIFNNANPAKASAMSREVYKLLYFEISRLQFGNKTEAELRAAYPAIEQFATNVDSCTKPWVSMVTQHISARKKLQNKFDIEIARDTTASIAPKPPRHTINL